MTSLCLLLALQVASSPKADHPVVTATSVPPQLISHIRAEYTRIQGALPSLRKLTRDLGDFSTEGGQLTAFFRDSTVQKITVWNYGETFRDREEDFYEDGRLFFALIVLEVYDRPLSGRVAARIEHRLYFNGDTLLRVTRSQHPARTRIDYSWRDPDPSDVLWEAGLYLACANAAPDDYDACSAPQQASH